MNRRGERTTDNRDPIEVERELRAKGEAALGSLKQRVVALEALAEVSRKDTRNSGARRIHGYTLHHPGCRECRALVIELSQLERGLDRR